MKEQIAAHAAGRVMGPLRVVRLRVCAILLAGVLMVFGLVSLAAWPVWPVLGVTLAAVAVAVNAVTTPLAKAACWNCGHSLDGIAPGTYGVACPDCGSFHQGLRTGEAVALLPAAEDDGAAVAGAVAGAVASGRVAADKAALDKAASA